MSFKKIMLILGFVLLSTNLIRADEKVQTKEEITRAAMQANKKAIVAHNINLTPEQEKIFWPMYDDYQIEINKLNADRMALLAKFALNFNSMTDEMASELTDDSLAIEKKRSNLKKELVDKFGKKFPPKIVARYLQIENKLEIAGLADAEAQIPLMK